jgi:hypothetical protein
VKAINSALLIVCLSGYDLISMRVVVCVCGLTMDAPSVGFPVFYPSVYKNLFGFHATWNGLNECFWGLCVGLCMSG